MLFLDTLADPALASAGADDGRDTPDQDDDDDNDPKLIKMRQIFAMVSCSLPIHLATGVT